jgi:hypothetical protein
MSGLLFRGLRNIALLVSDILLGSLASSLLRPPSILDAKCGNMNDGDEIP